MEPLDDRTRPSGDFERGKREGRVDALLESHGRSITAIRDEIKRFTALVESLSATVHKALDQLSDGLRTMQEEGRARDLAVKVAAETLAKETERRRAELETSVATTDRSFTKRERIAGLVLGAVTVVVTVLAATGHL